MSTASKKRLECYSLIIHYIYVCVSIFASLWNKFGYLDYIRTNMKAEVVYGTAQGHWFFVAVTSRT